MAASAPTPAPTIGSTVSITSLSPNPACGGLSPASTSATQLSLAYNIAYDTGLGVTTSFPTSCASSASAYIPVTANQVSATASQTLHSSLTSAVPATTPLCSGTLRIYGSPSGATYATTAVSLIPPRPNSVTVQGSCYYGHNCSVAWFPYSGGCAAFDADIYVGAGSGLQLVNGEVKPVKGSLILLANRTGPGQPTRFVPQASNGLYAEASYTVRAWGLAVKSWRLCLRPTVHIKAGAGSSSGPLTSCWS
jgi:hypothetical protein